MTIGAEVQHIVPVFSYTIQKANNEHFFHPRLSQSQMFDLYDELMIAHKACHGGEYDEADAANNMKQFFGINDEITDEHRQLVNNYFDNITHVSEVMVEFGLNADLRVDNNHDGRLIIDFPIDPSTFYTDDDGKIPLTAEEEERLARHSLRKKSRKEFSSKQFLSDHLPESSKLHPGKVVPSQPSDLLMDKFFDTFRFTPSWKLVDSRKLMSDSLDIMNKNINEKPKLFGDTVAKFQGINTRFLNEQIAIVFEVIIHENNYEIEPHWSEIIAFIFNDDGESLNRLRKYMFSENAMEFAVELDDLSFERLYSHLSVMHNKQYVPKDGPNLWTYTAMMGLALHLEEKEEREA